jgi:hypothetical protein
MSFSCNPYLRKFPNLSPILGYKKGSCNIHTFLKKNNLLMKTHRNLEKRGNWIKRKKLGYLEESSLAKRSAISNPDCSSICEYNDG